MMSIDVALKMIGHAVDPLEQVTVPLAELVGRRLAKDLIADVDSPPHDKSLMDGYAVRTQDLGVDAGRFEVVETIAAGDVPTRTIGRRQTARIMTGAPLAATGGDQGREWVQFGHLDLKPGHHILLRGSAISAGRVVLSAGHEVRAMDIGVMAEIGCADAAVYRRPTVAILATGNELVPFDRHPGAGQIRNSNGPLLMQLAQRISEDVIDLGIARDDADELAERCRLGLQSDVLILSGGVSEGIVDLAPSVFRSLQVECVFHKVSIKPGKPIWFGAHQDGGRRKFVFGLPGNPLSSLVCFRLFVCACVNRMTGGDAGWPAMVPSRLSKTHAVRGARPTFWPARGTVDGDAVLRAEPLPWQGSSDLRCLVDANGWVYLQDAPGEYRAGATVPFLPFADVA